MTAAFLIAGVMWAAGPQSGDVASSQPAVHERAARQVKLIEFGWDEPDTAFMRQHAAQMDASPFDGCVFHINSTKPDASTRKFTWDCWGKRAFTADELQNALDDLKQTRFKHLKYNFLRFNTTPADIDWFDDHSAVLNNARLAASIAHEAGAAGLLFDIEQYEGKLFDYHRQRDAATKSWDVYAAQVRLRGREVIEAFQQEFPNLHVLLTFGYSLPWAQSENGKKPLADCEYGLLAPFMDGMVDGLRGSTRLIDGCELAYGFRQEKGFATARKMMTQDVLKIAAKPGDYQRALSVSYGLWMDYDWRKLGWDTTDLKRNPHTPEQFGQLVGHAMRYADDYVWIYTETPRWWSEAGGPVKLPAAYDAAIRAAKSPSTQPR